MAPRTWLITGVSRGLGLAIAEAALARSDRVIGTTRDGTGGPLAGRNGFEPLRLDLATLRDGDPALTDAFAKAGRLDVLVNNAGYGLLGPIEAANADEIARLFAVILFGPLALMRSVLPIMRAQRAGRIINVTSMAARAPLPATGTYAAAKAAVEALSVALAQEVEPFGIHVISVAPGTMKTDFFGTSSLVRTTDAGSAYAQSLAAAYARFEAISRAQVSDPARVAEAMLRLADEPAPPRQLLIGSDALEHVSRRLETQQREIAEWRPLTSSTDDAVMTGSAKALDVGEGLPSR